MKLFLNQILNELNYKSAEQVENICLVSRDLTDVQCLSQMVNLKVIDLSNNRLQDVSVVVKLQCLVEIVLDNNQLRSIGFLSEAENLCVISARGNEINDLDDLKCLQTLKNLRKLDLAGNPICSHKSFYSTAVIFLQALTFLNDERVRDGNGLCDLDRFVEALEVPEGTKIELNPQSWLPAEAFEVVELPGFDRICTELEDALKESIQQYINKQIQ